MSARSSVLPTIRRLAPGIASRIAAGEVVERPLSALKEILENALDASARAVEVRVERSLDHFFSVADDGCGISGDELELALERHATSKISEFEDLDRLSTLGFRGEALPSIAAVSRMRITSRTPETEAAATVSCAGGEITARGDAARARGTTVEVSELFFNTPARRKFLHSSTGEMRSAIRMVECYSLAFPEIGFRLTVDGKTRLDLPAVPPIVATDPVAARRERATSLWGVRHAGQLLDADGARGGIHVHAFLGLPEHARATREGQIFLVNRRWIQSPALSQALRQAYGDLLPAGRFPAATLWLTVPPDRLDVNVHPTKREVRFADDSEVFAVVAGSCAKPLAGIHPPFTVVAGTAEHEPQWAERVREKPPAQTWLSLDSPAGAASHPAAPNAGEATPAPPRGNAAESEMWQLHRTYILAPVRGGLVIIDQHAAHERILYEQALSRLQGQRGVSQQLMFRSVVDLSQSQYDLALELGPWLQLLGWDLSLLGPPTVIVRGMPAELTDRPPGPLLQDVLDGVNEATGRSGEQDIAEQLARSYACHAAVRAGDPLDPAEMRSLVDRLFATTKPHGDPHGRVTFVRLDLDELHRRFGRA